MMTKPITVIVAVLIGVAGMTGCNRVSPCASLSAPTTAEVAAVRAGAEVEREVQGVDCELVNGGWVEEVEN